MNKNIVILIIVGVAVAGLIGYSVWQSQQLGELDAFATCLKDRGTVFYGAFWCNHCQAQKKMFGKSEKLLPYVECSTRDGRGQLQACRDENVEGYPTWEFADGSRESGEVPLKTLSEKTGCQLP